MGYYFVNLSLNLKSVLLDNATIFIYGFQKKCS